MIDRVNLLQSLPVYTNKKILVVENQDTKDIINDILSTHKKYIADYDRISGNFWRGSTIATAKAIFDFLKRNVKYSIEPDSHQSTKSPAAIIATGIYKDGYNDCKHYSLFIAGILDSLKRAGKNIDWVYRFANYKFTSSVPGHVFVVIKDNGNEIWVDPVLESFNDKKPYINKIDKSINTKNMALYHISGLDALEGIGKRKKGPKKKKKIFLKIGLAPSRAATLLLVRANMFKLATRLLHAMKTDEAKLKRTWENKGGKYSVLKKTILKAAKKKGLSGVQETAALNGIGAAPLAAALAAALPVLAALKELIGKIKGEPDPIQAGEEAMKEIAVNANGNTFKLPDFGAETAKIDQQEGTVDPVEPGAGGADDKPQGSGSEGLKQYLPYIVGGGILLYAVAKRS